MYRKSDLRFFLIAGSVANTALLTSFFLLLVYHFMEAKIVYRDLALLLLVMSWVLRLQIFVQKVEIIEVRLANAIEETPRRNRIPISLEKFVSFVYLVIFWVSAAGIVISFLPAGHWSFR